MIRVCNDAYADPLEGRRASVQLVDGTLRRGFVVGPDYAPPAGGSVVVWEREEVLIEWTDKDGRVLCDERGNPVWQPSDMGSGGLTKHRIADEARLRVVAVGERRMVAMRRAG